MFSVWLVSIQSLLVSADLLSFSSFLYLSFNWSLFPFVDKLLGITAIKQPKSWSQLSLCQTSQPFNHSPTTETHISGKRQLEATVRHKYFIGDKAVYRLCHNVLFTFETGQIKSFPCVCRDYEWNLKGMGRGKGRGSVTGQLIQKIVSWPSRVFLLFACWQHSNTNTPTHQHTSPHTSYPTTPYPFNLLAF